MFAKTCLHTTSTGTLLLSDMSSNHLATRMLHNSIIYIKLSQIAHLYYLKRPCTPTQVFSLILAD